MTPMEWVREKLYGHGRDVCREALDATDEATIQTRSLREQLAPYSAHADPFISMTRNRILAEAFNRQTSG